MLVVHAHPSVTSFSRAVADTTEAALRGAGHDVTVVHLDDERFRPAMSADERIAYETPAPILDPQVARHAELVRTTEATGVRLPDVVGGAASHPEGVAGAGARARRGVPPRPEDRQGAARPAPRAPARRHHHLRVVAPLRAGAR